jgi:hypothetical protein
MKFKMKIEYMHPSGYWFDWEDSPMTKVKEGLGDLIEKVPYEKAEKNPYKYPWFHVEYKINGIRGCKLTLGFIPEYDGYHSGSRGTLEFEPNLEEYLIIDKIEDTLKKHGFYKSD